MIPVFIRLTLADMRPKILKAEDIKSIEQTYNGKTSTVKTDKETLVVIETIEQIEAALKSEPNSTNDKN